MKSFPQWQLTAACMVLLVAIAGAARAQDSLGDKSKAPFSKLQVKPSAVSFKKLNLSKGATSETDQFTVGDKGTAALTVTIGTSTGNAAFVVTAGCGSINLEPGAEAAVTVEFQAGAAGKFSGSLAIMSNASKGKADVNVSLTGKAKGALPAGQSVQPVTACSPTGPTKTVASAGAPVGAMALTVTGAFSPPSFPISVPSEFPAPSGGIASAAPSRIGEPDFLARLESRIGRLVDNWPTVIAPPKAYGDSGFIAAYAPLGSWSEPNTGVALIPIAGSGVTGGTVSTPNAVNSCATVPSGTFVAGGANPEAVCVANGTDIYLIDGTTLVKTLTSAGADSGGMDSSPSFGLSFSGGSCTTCGVVVDGESGNAVIGVSTADGLGGYQVLNLSTQTLSGVIAMGPHDGIAEHIALMPISSGLFLALSPTEDLLGPNGPDYNIIAITPPTSTSSGGSSIFDFAGSSMIEDTELDTAALDSTGIIYALDEASGELFSADLTQVTVNTSARPFSWTAPSNLQDLTDLSTDDLCGMAVAYGAHEALAEEEFYACTIGAIKLPSTSGVGMPAASDWAETCMPDDPSGQPWENPLDPHGLTAAFASYAVTSSGVTTGTAHGFGLLMNDARTYVALIDLDALLAAPRQARSGPGANTVTSTYDLVANNVVTFLPFPNPLPGSEDLKHSRRSNQLRRGLRE
jgi:hypothetical protein